MLLKQQADGLWLPALFFVLQSQGLSFQMASVSPLSFIALCFLLPLRFLFSLSSFPFLSLVLLSFFPSGHSSVLQPSPSPSPPFPFQSSLLLKINTALVKHSMFIMENIFSLASHCLQADVWRGENPSFTSNYTYTSLCSQRNSKGLFTIQL